MQALTFAPPPPPNDQTEALRHEVRDFLAVELRDRPAQKRAESWSGGDPAFSRKMGERGWLGMMWPKKYGGHERSALERYVVLEEMLAAGAPVGYHWVAERQSGPNILKNGTQAQRDLILPRIARGELCFCIGMSEPDSGSDLAAARTRAERAQGGWLVNGTKVWTSSAHKADYMILFCRTGAKSDDDRHAGASQFLVDMKQAQQGGMTVRPIIDMHGEHHFNEVSIEDLLLPEDALLGKEGDGWKQVTGELAFERSGPDRFLSSFTLLVELVRELGPAAPERAAVAIGRITSHILALRRLSRSVAGMLQNGEDPALQASLVKDLGNSLEQEMVEIIRLLTDAEPTEAEGNPPYSVVLAHLILTAPSFSLRGGTREILRGIIARGLGLR
ncbi:acyl-CoA dehydrogenase family protein [Acidisphaera sp. L21]|uniref:acyl-CoA dehydrogenase family protein n=1 Tax=Acidisphaera sp. L21 TaxID=1641851 RepID=UPI00131D91D8|nr:acyl-CoA dehydrogenase family protein [Acidisphaera sp. L21]